MTSRRSLVQRSPAQRSLIQQAPALLLAALIAATAALPALTPLLRWQRDMTTSHEWYRLLSGHIVHANPRHATANLLALALLAALFRPALTARLWLLATPLCALLIGLLLFFSNVDWYVGFSGVLHGLLVLALCRDPRPTPLLQLALLAAVIAKIGGELLLGSDSGAWLGIAVASEAHAFGALSGGAIAALLAIRDRSATARRA